MKPITSNRNRNKITFQMKTLVLLTFFIASVMISGCGSEKGPDDLRKQLDAYHKQSKEIDQKIKDLEKQLAASENGKEQKNNLPVVLETLQTTLFEHYVEASGSVEPVKEAFISPEIGGQISAIFVKEGDRVQKGQLLARLNTQVTQKAVDEIKTSLRLATDLFERQNRLWEQKIGSEMQFLEAKNNKENLENKLATMNAQLEMSNLTSPISGEVEKVNQKNGEMASPGFSMIHIVSLDEVYVKANVSEAFLPFIKKGDDILLEFPSYPDFKMKLPVDRVGSLINPQNRTFEVQVKLNNRDGKIKPNMMAVLRVNDYANPSALVIPSKLLKEDLKGKYVYIAENASPELVARKIYVSPGKSYLGKSEILSGLKAGDRVILDGFNRVSDGSYLNVKANNTAK
jgi:membrane fusion protein, multidrug efflux system